MRSKDRHVRLCQCPTCVATRFEGFLENLEAFEAKNGIRPGNADQTVCVKRYTVRAHFRRNPHHLQGDEGLRDRVHSYFTNVTRPITKRVKAEQAHQVAEEA